MLSTAPGVTTTVPVGSASPLAAPLDKSIDVADGVAAEDEFRVELWVLLDETPECVEVGVIDWDVDEDHSDIGTGGSDIFGGGGGGGGVGDGVGEGGGGGGGGGGGDGLGGAGAPVNSQLPYMIPTDWGAKNEKRPGVISRPP